MVILKIMYQSFGQRAGRTAISITALAISVALLLIISHIHEAVRSYARQVSSEADLIVGGPAQPMHLVLYSLFRIGPVASCYSMGGLRRYCYPAGSRMGNTGVNE